jgi:hypothetical protein
VQTKSFHALRKTHHSGSSFFDAIGISYSTGSCRSRLALPSERVERVSVGFSRLFF